MDCDGRGIAFEFGTNFLSTFDARSRQETCDLQQRMHSHESQTRSAMSRTSATNSTTARDAVIAWRADGLLLERYVYAPGPAGVTSRHSHGEYQFCLSFRTAGSYHYRGARHLVPPGSLSVLHPGEMHSAQDLAARTEEAHFWMMYVAPERMQAIARGADRRASEPPFVATPVFVNRQLFSSFFRLHEALHAGASALEQEARVQSTLSSFLARSGAIGPAAPARAGREPTAVRRAREYLDAHFAENTSLSQLAAVSGLSPHRLNRVFSQTVGLPPHAYQTQLRIERAKALLVGRVPIIEVATRTGFFDQSHLTAHFKRHVGVTPGRYCAVR